MVAKKKLTKHSGDGIDLASQEIRLSGIPPAFLTELRDLITETRSGVAATINIGMTMHYLLVGVREQREILRNERAGYGKLIVHALSAQLKTEFGEGFGFRDLFTRIRFAGVFPDEFILKTRFLINQHINISYQSVSKKW